MAKYYLNVHNVRFVKSRDKYRTDLPVYREIGPFHTAEAAAAKYDDLVEQGKVHPSHFAHISAVSIISPKTKAVSPRHIWGLDDADGTNVCLNCGVPYSDENYHTVCTAA